MSRWAAIACLWGLVASASEGDAPQLIELKVRVGISEQAARELIVKNLGKLTDCIGFADYRNDLAPLKNLDRLDDRVEVALDVRRGTWVDPLGAFHWEARVESVLSDPQCVRDAVNAWPVSEALLESIHGGMGELPITFIYRYRPRASARAAAQQTNTAGMDTLCRAFTGATGPDVLSRWAGVKDKLPERVRHALEGTIVSLDRPDAVDVKVIFATAVRETGQMLGSPRPCRALRGWTYPDTAELLSAEEADLPAGTSCVSRVAQMRALASSPPLPVPVRAGEVSVEGARPFEAAGLVVDDDVYKFDPLAESGLLLPQAKISALAVEQQNLQKRPVPIVYLKLKAETPAVAVAEAARRWRQGFEVRVLGRREGPGPVGRAANAWKEALVSVAGPRLAIDSGELRSTIAAFGQHAESCPGFPQAVAKAGARDAQELGPLATAVADALVKCKCPRIFSEMTWARLSVIADAWDGRAGWVPLPVTDDRLAPVVTLPRRAAATALVRAVANLPAPVRVVWAE